MLVFFITPYHRQSRPRQRHDPGFKPKVQCPRMCRRRPRVEHEPASPARPWLAGGGATSRATQASPEPSPVALTRISVGTAVAEAQTPPLSGGVATASAIATSNPMDSQTAGNREVSMPAAAAAPAAVGVQSGGSPPPVVLMLVGMPGSGKSWFANALRAGSAVSWERVNQVRPLEQSFRARV